MRKTITLFAFFAALIITQAYAQDRTITGRITSSTDTSGIPGVSIVVPNTTIGATTNAEGFYSITVPPDATQLRLSGLGLKAKTVTIGTSSTINAVLDPDVLKLDEIVVTANAINREKRSLGYATQQVTGEELTTGENSNMIGAIEGKVAGVNINSNSGAPGASQRIVIRGGTSLTRNNQALLVVDGVPVDNSNFRTPDPASSTPDFTRANDLNDQVDYGNRGNDINPDDIESISVLKGPAAAALYGSRASNGAIIITTKKGHRTGGPSKMSVTFNSNLTLSSILKLPDFQNQYGEGDLDNIPDDRRENFSWGLPFDGKPRPWGQQINGQSRVKPYSAIPDNVKDFFDIGQAYRNSVSFMGGTEKSSYYLAFHTLNSKGIVPTTKYDKYNVLFNGTSELSNHFTTGISLNYSNISGTLPSGGQQNASIYDQLYQTPRDIPITEGKDLSNPFNAYNDITGTYGFYAGYTINPYFILQNYKNTNNMDRLLGNVSVSYSKWTWLTITDRLGGDVYGDRRYERWKKYDYIPADESDLFGLPDAYSDVNNRQVYQGKFSNDIYNFNSLNNDLMFNFKYKFNTDIGATLLLGHNIRQTTLTETYAQTNDQGGLGLPGYYNLENSNGPPFLFNSYTRVRGTGLYGDLNLSYKNMVFVGFSGRNDKTSTLSPENNSYFYPGVNASFVFSELFKPGLKDNIWTYGKLRAAWAKVGNDASAYLTSDIYSKTTIDGGFGSTTFPFNNIIGYTVDDRKGNPDITPEFTTAFEIGTELGFLKDALTFDFSYYQNSSTDQIISLPLAPSTGFTSKVVNTGEVQNKGIELAVRATPISTRSGFKWDIYATYTKNTNKVVSLLQGVQQITLGGTSRLAVVAQVGQPYGSFYGVDLQTDGQGHVVVDSATGMPLTTSDPVIVGNYQPDYQASLGTSLSYKGFTFNILFDTKQGGKFYTRTKDIMDFVGTAEETVNRADQIWPNSVYKTSSGQYVKNTEATYHPYDYFTNVIPDAQHVIDASYVKLREASLFYQFPTKWINRTPFGSVSIGVFGNNLAIWTPKENKYADPEMNSSGSSNTQGFDFTANPSQRNYGVDLKFTF